MLEEFLRRRHGVSQAFVVDAEGRDLGPHDALDVRLQAADTVVFLDVPLPRCTWRAIRRSPESADFWRWLFYLPAPEPSTALAGDRRACW
jgi:hypothetical protein